jgi:hypothetical protein
MGERRKDLEWMPALMVPAAGFLPGLLARDLGWISQGIALIVMYSGSLLVTVGLVYAFAWRLADVGLEREGLRWGLVAAGLLFVFYALPQWIAAFPIRWEELSWAMLGWVGVGEELWVRGLLYTSRTTGEQAPLSSSRS